MFSIWFNIFKFCHFSWENKSTSLHSHPYAGELSAHGQQTLPLNLGSGRSIRTSSEKTAGFVTL